MKNKITSQLAKIKTEKRIGLMTHVVAGCPSMAFCEKTIEIMGRYADFIEIQLPFSDPVADGPVMMRANEIALENKTKIRDAFLLAARVAKKVSVPLFFMGYFNTVFKMGVEKFCAEAAKAGISGVIFPDIPFDEALEERFLQGAKKHGLAFIQVVSENTTNARLKLLAKYAEGLVYCTARLGITGTHAKASENLSKYLGNVKKITKTALAVGFGVSSKADMQKIAGEAEVAVIGSAVMKIALDETFSPAERLKKIEGFLRELNC